jgi:AcrR family transcriptional regulator
MAAARQAKHSASDSGARAAHAYDGIVREQISDLQRARILSAMFEVAGERGAGGVTVAHVVERSGVSRRTFYDHFDDRENCLLAAFEQALALASGRVVSAYESTKGWREAMRAGLLAFLSFCDEEPCVARLLVSDSQASGPRVAERRAEILARLTRIVDQGRDEGKVENVSPLAAEGTVGGVLAVIQARLLEAKRKPLVALTNELTSMIVLPYLGPAAARRELNRPVPVSDGVRPDSGLLSDPFKAAGMRLTYRTVRVLVAIAQHPQASNREIGTNADITDQGQISKLLSRLQRLGLITNTGIHPGKGAPNSWTLTEQGRQIAQSIRANTEGESHRGTER